MSAVINRHTIPLAMSIFLTGLGFSVIMPILPYYADHLNATAFQVGLLITVYALCQLICAPLWGAFSDRAGRKPVLLLGLLGYALTFIWFALANTLWMLFLARILGGILACAALPTSMASMADLSSSENRGKAMGLAGASMGLGMIFGPALGGLLAGTNLGLPFLIAGLLALLNAVAVFFVLEEPLPPQNRHPVQKPEQVFFLSGLRTPIALLFIICLLAAVAETTHQGVFALYAKALLDVDATNIGWAFTVAGIVSVIVQGVFIGRILERWREERVIAAGLLILLLVFFLFSRSQSFTDLLIFMGIYAFGIALIRPALSAAVSRRTAAEQGQTMGVLQSFESMGRIIGPSIGGALLDIKLFYPYYWGMGVSALALLLLLLQYRRSRHKTELQTGKDS